MTDDSIERQRRAGRIKWGGFWVAGGILYAVGMAVETPELKSLSYGLRIVSLVFWSVALIFMVRQIKKERRWRNTGKWE